MKADESAPSSDTSACRPTREVRCVAFRFAYVLDNLTGSFQVLCAFANGEVGGVFEGDLITQIYESKI